MKEFKLIRDYKPEATIGEIRPYLEKRKICETLERPNLHNQRDDKTTPENDSSCIPEGRYICKRYSSPKHPDTWEITGVPNRSKILLHPANTIDQLLGCIAPCKQILDMNPENKPNFDPKLKWYASQSRDGFAALKKEIGDEDFILEITSL